MVQQELTLFHGEIIDNSQYISLQELLNRCHIEEHLLCELVEQGLIEPIGQQPEQWQFTLVTMQRAQKALRLHNDLGLDWQGIALTLDLLEEVEQLQQRLQLLDRHFL